MRLYRFHIVDGDRIMRDDEGVRFPDDRSALAEAQKAAADKVRDAALGGEAIEHQIIMVWDGVRLVGQVELSAPIRRLN